MNGASVCYLAEELSVKYDIYYEELLTIPVKGIRIWNHNGMYARKDFLYLTDNAESICLPRTDADPSVLVISLRGSMIPEHHYTWRGRILYLFTSDLLIEIQDRIQDVLDDYHAWYSNCIDMVLKGCAISAILDFAAQQLKNPIALFDATGILIHQAGKFQKNVEGTLWEAVLHSGFMPVEYIMPDELSRIMKEYDEGKRIITGTFRKNPNHHFWAASVILDDNVVGSCGSIDLNVPFSAGQESVIMDICIILEAAFRQADYLGVLSNDEHRCPKRLLQGFAANSTSIKTYLQARKWKENDTWRVYHFQLPSPDCTGVVVSAYINQLSYVMPLAALFHFEDAIIGIGRIKDFDPIDKNAANKLEDALLRISLRSFISAPFSDFAQLADYHGQCCLLKSLEKTNKHTLMVFANYYIDVLTTVLQEKASLRGFCHPVINALWTSGKEQNATLVSNLKCYLLNGRNIAETTRELGIHRNTLIYRLQKMENLLNVSLNYLDDNLLCYLLLSCILCTVNNH